MFLEDMASNHDSALWKNRRLFSQGDMSLVTRVIEALDYFRRVTGLIANLDKSNIFIAGVGDEVKQNILTKNEFAVVFILPQSVLKEIDRKCRMFLWNATVEKRKVALVAWDKVCVPKKFGELTSKNVANRILP
ncbi:hypothetical protein MTR67_020567 [Solanum verrucosum]|uniref:Uncharacterized protein n=1 Tax=Solanum verrucosum TaxID=315347 RepID=A0AAF0QQW2_SOLVR|nr:hypothetical protein MTR67_020567 [Solanum verrucosum]